jgi:hypothetical protein
MLFNAVITEWFFSRHIFFMMSDFIKQLHLMIPLKIHAADLNRQYFHNKKYHLENYEHMSWNGHSAFED